MIFDSVPPQGAAKPGVLEDGELAPSSPSRSRSSSAQSIPYEPTLSRAPVSPFKRNEEKSPELSRSQEKRQLSEPTFPPAKRKRYDPGKETFAEVKEEQPTSWFNYETTRTVNLKTRSETSRFRWLGEIPSGSEDPDEEMDSEESSSWSDGGEETQDPRDLSPEPFRVPPKPKRPAVAGTLSKKRQKTSQYVGVHWSSTYKKWKAKRTIQGRCINLGMFDDEKTAAEASDACIRKHGVADAKLNFPDEIIMFVEKIKKIDGDRCLVQWADCDESQDTWEPTSNLLETQAYKEFTGQTVKPSTPTSSKMRHSNYIGVSWSVRDGKWAVARSIKGKKMYGGTFSDEIEAAKASDELVRKYNDDKMQYYGNPPRLNFPSASECSKANPKKLSSIPSTSFAHLPKQRGSSKFVGVQWDKRRGLWKVERKINGKTVNGGHFDDEKEAARESDAIVRRSEKSENGHNHVINFPDQPPKPTQTTSTNEISSTSEGSTPLCGSHYVGVSWMNGLKKWRAERRLGGKSIVGGKFDTEAEAAKKSDEILKQYLIEANRTQTHAKFNFAVPAGFEASSLMNPKKKKKKTSSSSQNVEKTNTIPKSKYTGVSWCKREQQWSARRWIKGVQISGGTFSDEKAAARRSDELVRDADYPKGCQLNFPFDAGIHTDIDTNASSNKERQMPKPKPTIVSPKESSPKKEILEQTALAEENARLKAKIEAMEKDFANERKLLKLETTRLQEKVDGRIREFNLQERICSFQEKELKRLERKCEEQQKMIENFRKNGREF